MPVLARQGVHSDRCTCSIGGKAVNESFEDAVLDRLIFPVIKSVDGEEKAVRLASASLIQHYPSRCG